MPSSPLPKSWEFWIDVGGTFTDCIGRDPRGNTHRHKLLSTGITKGTVGDGSSASTIVDEHRQGDPPHFWVGFRCSLLDRAGATVAQSIVTRFEGETGALELADALPLQPGMA